MRPLTKIPKATAKRLPLYYRFIQNLSANGVERVSSAEISEGLHVDPATIRRDFSHFGELGRKGYGYNVKFLLSFLIDALHQDKMTKVILVGVGNLGCALIRYSNLKNSNDRIVMAFDIDPNRIGRIENTDIYHLDELEEKIKEESMEVAILTVPSDVAQSTTDRLTKAGIKGILNFTPVRIQSDPEVKIHHIDLTQELQSLIYFLRNQT